MNDEDNDNTHDEEGETIPSPEPPKPPKKGRFKFSMVGIKVGEILTFIPTGIKVKVSGDDSIEYEGRIYKLSPFVGTFMPEDKRNESGAYQGAKYFLYNGKIPVIIKTIILQREKNNKTTYHEKDLTNSTITHLNHSNGKGTSTGHYQADRRHSDA